LCVLRIRILPPWWEGFVLPRTLWAVGLKHKEKPSSLPVQQGLHIPNARVHVSKTPNVRAIMTLQDVRAGSTVNACNTCRHSAKVQRQHCGSLTGTITVPGNLTVQCHAADQVRCGRMTRPDVPTLLKISFATSSW
jgi:hypothetical protein